MECRVGRGDPWDVIVDPCGIVECRFRMGDPWGVRGGFMEKGDC